MNDKEAIKTFYAMLAMVGAKETGGVFCVEWMDKGQLKKGRIRFKSSADEITAKALGGRNVALKLLRHMEAAKFVCSKEPSFFGVISTSMEDVVRRFPILTSFYESAKIGAEFHTWWRNARE